MPSVPIAPPPGILGLDRVWQRREDVKGGVEAPGSPGDEELLVGVPCLCSVDPDVQRLVLPGAVVTLAPEDARARLPDHAVECVLVLPLRAKLTCLEDGGPFRGAHAGNGEGYKRPRGWHRGGRGRWDRRRRNEENGIRVAQLASCSSQTRPLPKHMPLWRTVPREADVAVVSVTSLPWVLVALRIRQAGEDVEPVPEAAGAPRDQQLLVGVPVRHVDPDVCEPVRVRAAAALAADDAAPGLPEEPVERRLVVPHPVHARLEEGDPGVGVHEVAHEALPQGSEPAPRQQEVHLGPGLRDAAEALQQPQVPLAAPRRRAVALAAIA
mmetsp:Transcript_74034/g.220906  ORF Transcript_74034/g.220906 Transcript_74034/m.220906 type:complete len:325 (-) Transcript_74034:3366-4340(-)